MSVRDADYQSRANGACLVVDHFLRGLRSIKKKKEKQRPCPPMSPTLRLRGEGRGSLVQGLGLKVGIL